jgi:hypothetical protein
MTVNVRIVIEHQCIEDREHSGTATLTIKTGSCQVMDMLVDAVNLAKRGGFIDHMDITTERDET